MVYIYIYIELNNGYMNMEKYGVYIYIYGFILWSILNGMNIHLPAMTWGSLGARGP